MREIVNLIPYFLSVELSIIVYNLCYINLNNHKVEKNTKNFMIITIVSLLIFVNNSYDNLYLKFTIMPIICCASYKILYKDGLKRTIVTYMLIFFKKQKNIFSK